MSSQVLSFVQEYISLFGNSEEVYFENRNVKAIDALLEKHFEIKVNVSWKLERYKNMKNLFETHPLMFEGLWEGVYNNSTGFKVSANREITRITKKRPLPVYKDLSEIQKYNEYKKIEKKIKMDVENENKEKLEEDGTEFFSRLQKWFESTSQPYVHDFGNTTISGDKCRNVINYMASYHNLYRIQDRVHGNVLTVVRV